MMQNEDPEVRQADAIFPIADGIELHLKYDENFRALQGSETLIAATEVFAGALLTMHFKNKDYGGAWQEQGWRGNLARIMSKTTRLRHMLWNSNPVDSASEPVTDTLLDLINLTVFMMLNRQGGNEWGPGRS